MNREALKVIKRHFDRAEFAVILTARPYYYLNQTSRWLWGNDIKHDTLIMRGNYDHRHSVDIKQDMLVNELGGYGIDLRDIVAAYDDHPDILEMYKRHGIPNVQQLAVREHKPNDWVKHGDVSPNAPSLSRSNLR